MRFSLGFIAALFMAGPAFAGSAYIAGGVDVGSFETPVLLENYTDVALAVRVGV